MKHYNIESLEHPPIDSSRCNGRSQWYSVTHGSIPIASYLYVVRAYPQKKWKMENLMHTLFEKVVYKIVVILDPFFVDLCS